MCPDETQTLYDYNAAKREVASLVRAVRQFMDGQRGMDAEQCQPILAKLAEDRFNLAVVGQFKRGKSTLMNAVIGRDLLPTGILPLTSVVTTLCYGPRERVVLRRKGWIFEPEISLRDLEAYVSERGNPGNEKGILEARVELPMKLLRQGLHFSDTPGIGSARRDNTETTYSFLPEADAVIWVTSVEAPLSEAEQEFLRDIRQLVRKVFVVVNKVDLLTSDERRQVLDYIESGIRQLLDTSEVRLYPLSARQGLEAKLRGHEDELQQSGLPEFEASLTAFLAHDKSRTFLVAILDRALKLLLDGRDSASPDSRTHVTPPGEQCPEARSQLGELSQSIEALRAALLDGLRVDHLASKAQAVPADTEILKREVAASRVTTQQPRKRNAPQVETCPICAQESEAAFGFFAHWQYALSTTAQARSAFAAARGFCHVHTWQFEQIASPQGIAEGYVPLVEAAAGELRQLAGVSPLESFARLGELMPEAQTCPVCQILRETAQAKIDELLASLGTDEGRARYGRSRGVCLPHLRMILAHEPAREIVDLLLREQVEYLEELSEDMRSFVLKRDARRRGLINDNEEKAWRHALVQLMGERTAQYCWPE